MIYFDNAASTPCHITARDAMWEAYGEYSNVHRGLHHYSMVTTNRYEEARRRVAEFIQADPGEVVFTGGTTDALNLVARGWGDQHVSEGDEIIVTRMEHHSNLIPWQQLAKRTGARLRALPLSRGHYPVETLKNWLSERVKIIAFPAVSNVLGCVAPIAAITDVANQVGAVVVVDAAQSIPHIPHFVHDMGIDFLAFSGHKMHGPTGIGVLYAKQNRLEEMEPVTYGGGMVNEVKLKGYIPRSGPEKLEAGTPPIIQAIGLGEVITFWQRVGMENVHQRVKSLTEYAYKGLKDGVSILGPSWKHRCGILSFTVDGIHPHDLAGLLDKKGIAVRAGHHCAQPLHEELGIPASTRISFSYFNTIAEIDRFMEGLTEIQATFKRWRRDV